MVQDRPFEDIIIGERASFSKTISEADVYAFAGICGDFNPVHVNEVEASKSRFKGRIAHGLLTASLISTVLGTALPGKGTVYLGNQISFWAPCYIGDTLTAEVEVVEKREDKRVLVMKTRVLNQSGKVVIDGQAIVMKP
ncbi:MAG: (R)-specific enoyl-CoA hydratase [Pelotomaculum sp. PtaB.Bin104]|nr:MAG: (R)-specific enoyl-CoA hydratase [Pelotomaculum sp. PtaB.Bin104]